MSGKHYPCSCFRRRDNGVWLILHAQSVGTVPWPVILHDLFDWPERRYVLHTFTAHALRDARFNVSTNAAIVHYSPDPVNSAVIKKDQVHSAGLSCKRPLHGCADIFVDISM
jgi:hypothetical protein